MINWFEIPVANYERAKKFYEEMFDIHIHTVNDMPELTMGFFPGEGQGVSGAIVQGDDYTPSSNGALLYLNGGEDLNNALSRVEANGGKVILPKTPISEEFGNFALFLDTEGNKIGIHSRG